MKAIVYTAAIAALLFSDINGLCAQSTWYVRKHPTTSNPSGKTQLSPFNSLVDAEKKSAIGDTIMIMASDQKYGPLDGGIRLKASQKLLGMGAKVTQSPLPKTRAWITNKTAPFPHLGDAVVLANGCEVAGIHIGDSARCAVFAKNVGNVNIHDLLVTNGNTTSAKAPRSIFGSIYAFSGITFLMTGNTVAKPSRVTDCVVKDSTISGGVLCDLHGASKAEIVVRRSRFTDLRLSATSLITYGTSEGKLTSEGCSVDNTMSRGIGVWSNEKTRMELNVSDFKCESTKNLLPPSGIEVVFSGESKVVCRIEDSTIRDSKNYGILAMSYRDFSNIKGELDVHIENVEVTPASGYGILVGADSSGNLGKFTATLKRNVIRGGNGAILCGASNNSAIDDAVVVMDGNVVEGVAGWGLYLYSNAIAGNVDATIVRNMIRNAKVGIHLEYLSPPKSFKALLANNLVAGSLGFGCQIANVSPVLLNNTVVGGADFGLSSRAASPVLTNNVFWGNVKGAITTSGSGAPVVTYCNIQGGHAGTGNTKADPLFVDAGNGDYHIRYDSPCRDKGNTLAVLNVLTTDFEGDPRLAHRGADMGADEFFAHLYHTGNPTSGGTVRINAVGKPTSAVLWALSGVAGAQNPPIAIPGLGGLLYLRSPILIIPMGQTASTGVISLSIKLPSNSPRTSVWTQALMGTRLSNLDVLTVN